MIGGPVRGSSAPTRLGYLARKLLEKTLTIDSELPNGKRPFPFTPETADFAEAFRLQLEWELNARAIEELIMMKPGRLEYLKERQADLEKEMNRP